MNLLTVAGLVLGSYATIQNTVFNLDDQDVLKTVISEGINLANEGSATIELS